MNTNVVNELDGFDTEYKEFERGFIMKCLAFDLWWTFYGKTEEEAWASAHDKLDELYPEEDE